MVFAHEYFVTYPHTGDCMTREEESPYLDEGVKRIEEECWSRNRKGLRLLTIRIRYLCDVIAELALSENHILRAGIRNNLTVFREYVMGVANGAIYTDREISKVVQFGAELEDRISHEISALFLSSFSAFSGSAECLRQEDLGVYTANEPQIEQVLSSLLHTTQCSKKSNLFHMYVGTYNRAQRLLPSLLSSVRERKQAQEIEADNQALLYVVF